MPLTITNDNFQAGNAIVASEINTNFTEIENYINNSMPSLGTASTFTALVTLNAGLTSTGGTTALGVTNITGNVNVGASTAGHAVVFHSSTASCQLHWDASDEILKITGVAGQNALSVLDGDVFIEKALDVNGGTTLDNVTIDGTISGTNPVTKVAYNASAGVATEASNTTNNPVIYICTADPAADCTDGDIWIQR